MKSVSIFILCLLLFAVIVILGQPWGGRVNQCVVASERMSRLISFINQKRRPGEATDFKLFTSQFGYEIRVMPEFFAEIEFVSIPENSRLKRFPDVDYYLFSKDVNIGMLSNGFVFYEKFERELIETSFGSQDVSKRAW